MAMNFPNNPSNGDVYQDYVYDSASGWRSAVMVGAAPCGSIMPFAGATVPAGWLLCNGAAVSRVTYSSLFAALGGISSPWGLGNGSTTFNVPDLRKRVPVGKGDSGTLSTLGAIGGAETMSLQEAHIAAHSHTFSATTSNSGDHNHAPPVAVTYGGNAGNYRSVFATNSPFWSGGDWNNAVTGGGNHSHTLSGTTGTGSGSGSAFGLLQPYAVVNYIIKFSAVVAATDTEIAVRMGQAEATVTAQAAIIAGYESRVATLEQPGRVLQVAQKVDSAQAAYSGGGGFYAYSNLAFTVTPKKTNSKFLIRYQMNVGAYFASIRGVLKVNGVYYNTQTSDDYRASTNSLYMVAGIPHEANIWGLTGEYLYTHSGSGNVDIQFELYKQDAGYVIYTNRAYTYNDTSRGRPTSWVTVTEIAT